MKKIIFDNVNKVAVVRFNNGVTNPIDIEFINDLEEAVLSSEKEFNGLVLTGGDKFFSIGFNLPQLIGLDRKELTYFFHRFNELILKLFTLNIPTCAAIKGHAIAGGCIIAISCDYIFANEDKKLIGLNEVKLGLPVPYLADVILRQKINDTIANDLLFTGEFITTQDARKAGLISETYSIEQVENKAIEKIEKLTLMPKDAVTSIKNNRLDIVVERYMKYWKEKEETFINLWFKEETQQLLKEAANKF